MKKVQTIKNIEGILLHSKEAGNGNRIVFIFTKNYGNQTAFVSQRTIKSFGSGLLMPFTYLRCSMAETSFDKWTLIQYEGKNICDISKFSYEDWCRWCFVIEIIKWGFPLGEKDINAYIRPVKCLKGILDKNKQVSAYITALQMLYAAGYDASAQEMCELYNLSDESKILLQKFINYSWEKPMGINISKEMLKEIALYLDKFVKSVCDMELKSKKMFI